MSIVKNFFANLPDGREVNAYTLTNASGMSVKIMDLGGTIMEINVPDRDGKMADVIGGYDNIESYLLADGYQGALIGRFGNRIAKGKFTLDGKDYTLYINNGDNHLHGGKEGYDKKIWDVLSVLDTDEPALVLHYLSPDMEEGYPGDLDLTVTYTLTSANALSIRYVATTTKKTILNLTNHAYFNLGGYSSGDIYAHELRIDADSYLPTDEGLIPTGEFRAVEGTAFDFRIPKAVGKDIGADDPQLIMAGGGYDHNFNFNDTSLTPSERAELYDPKSGRCMKVITNQPCVQLYAGNFLGSAEHPFKGGYPKQKHHALCLETQAMPDSINQKGFTNVVLDVGETYYYTTVYEFGVK